MLGQFLPPVVFEITANATQAMATFKGVNTQLKTMEAQALKTGKALTGFTKAAVIGTRALKAFGLVAVGIAAIGTKAAMDLEKSYNRLGQALSNMGVASERNRAEISELMQSYEDLGFGAEKAADAYAVLITSTGSVSRSNRLLMLSADLARAKTMDLESAARALTKAANGNTRIFKEFGITIDASKDKTVAIEEAMAKLEARLGGQAAAYTKTFAGQVAVLNEKIGDLFEAIGMKVIPVLTKFIDKINGAGKFVRDHNEVIIALAAAITIALIPAVVNLTKKLALLALTILKSPLARLAIVIFSIVYAFVKLYNQTENNRKMFAKFAQFVVDMAKFMVDALENVWWVIAEMLPLAFANFLKLIGKVIPLFKTMGEDLEKSIKSTLPAQAFQKAKDELLGMSVALEKIKQGGGKPIKLKWDFKIPQIPGFGDGDGGTGIGDGIAEEIAKGLARARQSIKDFNRDAKAQFKELVASWKGIINRDFAGEIEFWLDDSVDELVKKAQLAVNAYAQASEGYASAMSKLTTAQNEYIAAVKTGKEEVIMAAESALGAAENAVNGVMDAISSALGDVKQLQDEMIQAIVATKREIAKLEEERTKILEEAQAERLKLEDKYNKTVADIRLKYEEDVLAAETDAANRRAEIIKSSVDMLRDAFRSATYRSVGDIYDALTFQGRYLKGGTTEKIIAALGLQANKAEKLADNAAQLAGLGFSQTFIQEVIALGPDVGNELARTILNSTPESIKQLQAYWNRLQQVSNYGVDNLAKEMNSGITLATDELTKQLADVTVELNATLQRLDKELTKALADAFVEYSDALEEINKRTAQQIREIDAQIAKLLAKIAQLEAALLALQGLGMPGSKMPPLRLTPPVLSIEHAIAEGVRATAAAAEAAAIEAEAEAAAIEAEAAAAAAAAAAASSEAANGNILLNALLASLGVTDSSAGNSRGSGLAGFRAAESKDLTINVTANTNASPQEIAQDVGWVIRTSGDVQYRTANPFGGRLGEQ